MPGDDYSYVVRHYQFTDPRSDYYVDHWDPTTMDYGNYYRQEYNDTKDYVQALCAEEEAAAAAALRAPQQAAQQGVLARLRRPLPPPFDDAEDYLGALFAIGGLARGDQLTRQQRQQQDACRRLRDRLMDAQQEIYYEGLRQLPERLPTQADSIAFRYA
jgi:hypothetical protein